MKKYLFRNDYSFGAHPKVLEAVCAVNLEGNHGYGDDGYTARAKERIREAVSYTHLSGFAPDSLLPAPEGGTVHAIKLSEDILRQFFPFVKGRGAPHPRASAPRLPGDVYKRQPKGNQNFAIPGRFVREKDRQPGLRPCQPGRNVV